MRRLLQHPVARLMLAFVVVGGPFVLANAVTRLGLAAPALLLLTGCYQVRGWGSAHGMGQMLKLHLFVALLEELLFRGLFGLPVSGTVVALGLLSAQMQGPSWATGGAFGVEASVITLALTVVLCAFFARRARQHGRWRSAPRHSS